LLAARRVPGAPAVGSGEAGWTGFAVASAVALLGAVGAGGAAGALCVALAVPIAWLGGRNLTAGAPGLRLDSLAAAGAAAELASLLCFAAWHPQP
jgi:hypothetical protein